MGYFSGNPAMFFHSNFYSNRASVQIILFVVQFLRASIVMPKASLRIVAVLRLCWRFFGVIARQRKLHAKNIIFPEIQKNEG